MEELIKEYEKLKIKREILLKVINEASALTDKIENLFTDEEREFWSSDYEECDEIITVLKELILAIKDIVRDGFINMGNFSILYEEFRFFVDEYSTGKIKYLNKFLLSSLRVLVKFLEISTDELNFVKIGVKGIKKKIENWE